jgi:hypothetical protein
MLEPRNRLFAGIKISAQLQNELSRPAPGTEHYFKSESPEYLHIITLGEQRFIGRFLNDGFPATSMEDVSRNVCSIVRLIARGHRVEEKSVQIYIA